MIPALGPVDVDDIRTELSLTGTVDVNYMFYLMGESTNPDKISEARGYDYDWLGWLQAIDVFSNPDPPQQYTFNTITYRVRNYSVEHSYSGTLYWEIKDQNGSLMDSGSSSFLAISPSSYLDINIGDILISDETELNCYAKIVSADTMHFITTLYVAI